MGGLKSRRSWLLEQLGVLSAGALATHPAITMAQTKKRLAASKPHVVVVGGGYGGATAAKYIRMWSQGGIRVTLIEPNREFVSCPISNLVIGGVKRIQDITIPYVNLRKRHGIEIVHDYVTTIDPDKRQVRLQRGNAIKYDRLILSPGVDFIWESLPSMRHEEARKSILHAWKAGAQTLALRQQLIDMPDGGVFALAIPRAPYRCPPGPYERACLVAHYFKTHKPKSKVLVLDANDDVTSKAALFKKAWAQHYDGILEYRPKHQLVDVDVAQKFLQFDFNDSIKADVLNVIPQMRAGNLALHSGLATVNNRWCDVDFLTFESKAAANIHIIGDAIQIAPAMPKSGHMANQHGKTVAAAIVALFEQQEVNPLPLYNNTCYSFVTDKEVVHVASVHRYDREKKTMLTVPGSGGVSNQASELEGHYALAWAQNIWADTLG